MSLKLTLLQSFRPIIFTFLYIQYLANHSLVNKFELIFLSIISFFIVWQWGKKRVQAIIDSEDLERDTEVSSKEKFRANLKVFSIVIWEPLAPIIVLGSYIIVRDNNILLWFLNSKFYEILAVLVGTIYYPFLLLILRLKGSLAFPIIFLALGILTYLTISEKDLYSPILAILTSWTTVYVALEFIHNKLQTENSRRKKYWNQWLRFLSWNKIRF